MFTGIITDVGLVEIIQNNNDDIRLSIATSYDADSIAIGASIACSGVCLTVTEKGEIANGETSKNKSWFSVDVSQETISCTLIDQWQKGDQINLERSLKFGDEMGGHIVKGHVDGIANIVNVQEIGDSWRYDVEIPNKYKPYLAEKGSISLNGISLTINEVNDNVVSVNIIPHTYEFTNINTLQKNSKLHFEIDILSRYAKKITDNIY